MDDGVMMESESVTVGIIMLLLGLLRNRKSGSNKRPTRRGRGHSLTLHSAGRPQPARDWTSLVWFNDKPEKCSNESELSCLCL